MAVRVFERIERAEKEIHGHTDHFHEVGADDAVAEVVGACTAFLSLNVDGCVILPVMLGGGSISGSHGTYPVPAPATLSIIKESDLVVRFGTPEDGELCTPTGAALLSEFSTGHSLGNLTCFVAFSGYGADTKNPPHMPNVLRAMIVESAQDAEPDDVDLLETNVADVSAEILAYTFSRLTDEGASDVSAIPCTMKKGRPGHLVRVVAASGEGLGADHRLLFRAEAVNLLNTPQFAEPWRELSSPGFGFITNTLNEGRTFRFLLHYLF